MTRATALSVGPLTFTPVQPATTDWPGDRAAGLLRLANGRAPEALLADGQGSSGGCRPSGHRRGGLVRPQRADARPNVGP
jgi:hypothetical protein